MDDAPSSFDIDSCAAPASDGGVSPSMIPIPKVDREALEAAASALRTAGENIEETADDIKTSWGALSPVYVAPESEALLSALDPITVDASDVAAAAEDAAWALEGFAISAGSIKNTLIGLKEEAQEFREEVGWDDEWLDDEIHRATNDGINNRVAEAVQAYQEAERECANAIGEYYDGTRFIGNSDKAQYDQTETRDDEERNRELYGDLNYEVDQVNPWGGAAAIPTGDTEDGLAGVGVFIGDMAASVGMTTGLWRDGQAAYPLGTQHGENMLANWDDLQETFFAVIGSDAQGEWKDPGSAEAQWENSQAALAVIGNSIIPVSEYEDRPYFTISNGGLNTLAMLSPFGWLRVSGDASGSFDTSSSGDREGGTAGSTPGGVGGTDTPSSPEPPATHPDLTSSLQNMDESLQRLNEQLGGGHGGAPDPGPGPGATGSGEGSGPGSGDRSGESTRPEETGPTPRDEGSHDRGGGPAPSTNPEGGTGREGNDSGDRGEPGTGTRTDDGRRDDSGARPDPTSQGLRDTTRGDGADRSTDPWTTSPRGDQSSPAAPALRDPNENGNPSPRDGDRSSPATPREDSGSPAPSTDGGGSDGGHGPDTPLPWPGDDQGPGNQGNGASEDRFGDPYGSPASPSDSSSEFPGTVGPDGIRRFQDTVEAERYANQVLDNPRMNPNAFDNLPAHQQSAVWTYTRNSWLNSLDRLGDPRKQQQFLDYHIERTRSLMNSANPGERARNAGWSLYEMNNQTKPTMRDIQDARTRGDLSTMQRELVNDILGNKMPHKRLADWLANAGFPGHMAESNGGRYPTMQDARNLTSSIDSAVRSPLPEGLQAIRGLHGIDHFSGYNGDISSIVGTIQSHSGYTSTSIGSKPTVVDGNPFRYNMNLDITHGTGGLWVGDHSAFKGQREIILPRGVRINITGARQIGVNQFEIDARTIPAGWR